LCTPDGEVTRSIELHADSILIVDTYRLQPQCRPASDDAFKPAQPLPISPGYGVQLN
jgi:hypothetical protein